MHEEEAQTIQKLYPKSFKRTMGNKTRMKVLDNVTFNGPGLSLFPELYLSHRLLDFTSALIGLFVCDLRRVTNLYYVIKCLH